MYVAISECQWEKQVYFFVVSIPLSSLVSLVVFIVVLEVSRLQKGSSAFYLALHV